MMIEQPNEAFPSLPMLHHALVLTRGAEELPRLIDAIDAFCGSVAASDSEAHSLHLAIEEIVSNVWQHGYGGALHPLVVNLETIPPNRIRATVTDYASPYNPLGRPEVDTTLPLEERPVGGLGVHLVKKLMSEIRYERRDGENLLSMELVLKRSTERLTPAAAPRP